VILSPNSPYRFCYGNGRSLRSIRHLQKPFTYHTSTLVCHPFRYLIHWDKSCTIRNIDYGSATTESFTTIPANDFLVPLIQQYSLNHKNACHGLGKIAAMQLQSRILEPSPSICVQKKRKELWIPHNSLGIALLFMIQFAAGDIFGSDISTILVGLWDLYDYAGVGLIIKMISLPLSCSFVCVVAF